MKPIHPRGATLFSGNGGTLFLIAFFVLLTNSVAIAQQNTDNFFPEPFFVEHQVIRTEADGGVFAGDVVKDYYGGSWIVSERPNGSRMVVDFARRELMEIRPERGTFTVLSFDRFAELRQRLRQADNPTTKVADPDGGIDEATEPRFTVDELAPREGLATKAGGPSEALVDREGVRRLRIGLADESGVSNGPKVDIWFDPSIRFGPSAMAALEDFEETLARGEGEKSGPSFTRYVREARRQSGGSLPFRTVRPMTSTGDGGGTVEDRADRVESLTAFPTDLLEIPEGFTRVPHQLELIVAHAEEEAELRAKMSPKTSH